MATNICLIVFGGVDRLFRTYPAAGVLLCSGGAFYGGYQYMRQGQRSAALQWQILGALMAIGFSVGALLSKMWLSGMFALSLFGAQVCLMLRWFPPRKPH